jgi:hypothetical protein
MSKSDFFGLMRHPKWQKRRLEVLDIFNFTCTQCRAGDLELHVHHKIYRTGAKPWEYDDIELTVICKPCHEKETERVRAIREAFFIYGDAKSIDAMAYTIMPGCVTLKSQEQVSLSEIYDKTNSMKLHELLEVIQKIDEIFERRHKPTGRCFS